MANAESGSDNGTLTISCNNCPVKRDIAYLKFANNSTTEVAEYWNGTL